MQTPTDQSPAISESTIQEPLAASPIDTLDTEAMAGTSLLGPICHVAILVDCLARVPPALLRSGSRLALFAQLPRLG
jgi:hypothetical protein